MTLQPERGIPYTLIVARFQWGCVIHHGGCVLPGFLDFLCSGPVVGRVGRLGGWGGGGVGGGGLSHFSRLGSSHSPDVTLYLNENKTYNSEICLSRRHTLANHPMAASYTAKQKETPRRKVPQNPPSTRTARKIVRQKGFQ